MYEVLREQFRYYLDHQAEFVERYNGRFIVLNDFKVVGDFPSRVEAVLYAMKNCEPCTFQVQLVTPGNEAYTTIVLSPIASSFQVSG